MDGHVALEKLFQDSRLGQKVTVNDTGDFDLEYAYRIQNSISKSKFIGAWKLGGTTDLTRKLFKTKSAYYGSIESRYVFNAGEVVLPKFIERPVGELEITFKLSREVENLAQFDLQSEPIDTFIDSVLPSIEMPWSQFLLPEAGLNVLVADSCAAGLLILGEEYSWNSDAAIQFPCQLNGNECLAEGDVNNIVMTPSGALREFLLLAKQHQLNLRQGQYVATGGCTACVSLPVNEILTVEFQELGGFSFKLLDE
uniref:2-keto-4-pentenoate hydratase n=1 Tax=Rheinheimera sp. BAL341 TaxID=1708203 RepID=A0A486XVC4_9GAMM